MIAYFDCFSGISGDMTLGALVDAGASFSSLKKSLSALPVKGYKLQYGRVKKAGFAAAKVDVIIAKSGNGGELRKWSGVRYLIEESSLPAAIKKKGKEIFKRLFEAEAFVHGSRYDRVHLHELAAVDCIVDIMGSLICLDLLGIDKIYASAVNTGGGSVSTAHGVIPVPSPAAMRLLKGVPVYSSVEGHELTTPTGAAIISTLASSFGPVPLMKVTAVGTGAGGLDLPDRPNILRVITGEVISESLSEADNNVMVIETNIDDMNPQLYEYVMEQLFRAGALDVFLSHIIMKKGRPGIKLSVLCQRDKAETLCDIIFRETTTIGVRYYPVARKTLKRGFRTVQTGYGPIRIKISDPGGPEEKCAPEYEECRRVAKARSVPLIKVIDDVKLHTGKAVRKRPRK